MPRPLHVCAVPGCSVLLRQGGRCARHAKRPWQDRPGNGKRRYSAGHDAESKRLREAGTLCSYCGAEPMTELDHEIPLSQGGQDVPENRRPIGRRCHARKTQAEARAGRECESRVIHRLSGVVTHG